MFERGSAVVLGGRATADTFATHRPLEGLRSPPQIAGSSRRKAFSKSMSNCNEELKQTDEKTVFGDEISDEALEAASFAPQGLQTVAHNTYCFACPS